MPTAIGIIGAGSVVEHYHLPVLRQLPEFEVRWIVDKEIDQARAVAKLFGVSTAGCDVEECGDVDAVLVATPVSTRRQLLEKVCSRGWDALCEKPFAPTVSDHRYILEIAQAAGVRLGIGLVRRYYQSTATAARLLESRALGPITGIVAGEGAWLRRTGRGGDWYQASAQASGGGALAEMGSHLVDQVFTICGVEDYDLDHCRQVAAGDLEFETSVKGSMRLNRGEEVPFSLVVTRLSDVYNGVVVQCATGQLRVPTTPHDPLQLHASDGAWLSSIALSPAGSQAALFQAVAAEWRAFAAASAASQKMTDWDTGLLTTRFVEECYRSSNTVAAEQVQA